MLATLALAAQATFVPLSTPLEADGLADGAFLPAGSSVALVHEFSDRLTLVPVAPGGASGSASTGIRPTVVEVTPDGSLAVVANAGDSSLSLIELPSMLLRGTVPVDLGQPGQILIDPQNAWAFVLESAPFTPPKAVIVDLISAQQIASFDLGPASATSHAVLAANGTTIVATGSTSQASVLINIDVPSASVISVTPVVGSIQGLARSGDGLSLAILDWNFLATPPAVVKQYDIATMSVTASWEPALQTPQNVQMVFADSDNALFLNEGPMTIASATRIDLVTGAIQTLPLAGASDLRVSSDSSRAWFATRDYPNDPLVQVFEASTGSLLGTAPGPQLTRTIQPAPSGLRCLVIDSLARDRFRVLDLPGSANSVLLDSSSSTDEQTDGPLRVDVWNGSAVVVAENSDDLRLVDLGTSQTSARLELDRAPTRLAVRGGLALVGHAAGESLSIVDLAGPTELVRLALPGEVEEIYPIPGSSQVWLRLGGSAPALCRVEADPAAAQILALVPLAGEGNTAGLIEALFQESDSASSVAFDWAGQRAFAMSVLPAGLVLESIDLSTQAVVNSLAFVGSPISRSVLRLSPDGQSLYAATSRERVLGIDVPGSSLSVRFETTCSFETSPDPWMTDLELSADGSRLLMDFGEPALGACGGLKVLDAFDGSELQALGALYPNGLGRAGDVHWSTSLQTIRLGRFGPTGFDWFQTIVEGTRLDGELLLDRSAGRLIAAGQDIQGGAEGLVVADLLGPQTERTCSPAAQSATGQPATQSLSGSPFTGDLLTIRTSGLQPGGMVGYLLIGSAQVPPVVIGTSPSPLCIGGQLGRYTAQVQAADASGQQTYEVDSSALPFAGGPAVQPGESWSFQTWFRDFDMSGTPRTNFSDALTLTYL